MLGLPVRGFEDTRIAQQTIQPGFEAALDKVKVRFVGWTSIGFVRLITKGYIASTPLSMSGHHVVAGSLSAAAVELFSGAGAVVPRPPPPPPVGGYLPAPPNLLPAPPPVGAPQADTAIATSWQMQQFATFDYVYSQPLFWACEATVFNRSSVDSLPPDLARTFDHVADVAHQALATITRREDTAALQHVPANFKVVTHTYAEMVDWSRLYSVVNARLAGTTLDKGVVNRVLRARGMPTVP